MAHHDRPTSTQTFFDGELQEFGGYSLAADDPRAVGRRHRGRPLPSVIAEFRLTLDSADCERFDSHLARTGDKPFAQTDADLEPEVARLLERLRALLVRREVDGFSETE